MALTPEPYVVELDSDTKTTLKMYLFKDVKNVDVIKNNIIQGVWRCTAIKAHTILDPFQVAVAANSAVLSEKQNILVTKTVFSEILYNLSISRSISQSLSRFGIENSRDTELLMCFLITDEWDASKEVLPNIKGELCPMSDLKEFSCKRVARNLYKLKDIFNEPWLDIVVSRMVTKNFVTH